MRAHGSMDSGGAPVHGSPNIVGVPIAIALLLVSTSMIILGAPMTLGCLAAGCSLADSLITAGANWT